MDRLKKNWELDSTEILMNPRLSNKENKRVLDQLNPLTPQFPAHCWLATSGTTGNSKWVALSKKALLISAQSVNNHLNITNKDRWLHSLPDFHVGGLAIWARAYLSGSEVIRLDREMWEASYFYQKAIDSQATLTSLVPAQIFDLVQLQLSSPPSLRTVFVGSGVLSQSLFTQAVKLGWQLIPTYGMTECSSQIATGLPQCSSLHILPHVELRVDKNNLLSIKSDALLTAYAEIGEDKPRVWDPKVAGWLLTSDLAKIEDHQLNIIGRSDDILKVGGEAVNFSFLEKRFEEVKMALCFSSDAALIAKPDQRLGHTIHLVVTGTNNIEDLISSFNSQVMPFERIRDFHQIATIPRSQMNKVLRKELLNLLS